MSTEDRRAPGVSRILFDGLVEVGATLGPSFEARAVNVSEEGMQIRTAYLPEPGQQMTCRFETAHGRSVVASGDVVWSHSADNGGEFGIRFTDMDADSVNVLKKICGGTGESVAAGQPGAKVRLYIEGLASPMRAKVREAQATAITVGSDLGFLQVGKHLQLEDAMSGNKRPASIDRVDVTVDPTSHIPQLVVTLRYADVAAGADESDLAAQGAVRARAEKDATDRTGPVAGAYGSPTRVARVVHDDMESADEASAHERMKGAFARQAARVGPAIHRLASRARATAGILWNRRRAEGDWAPKRMTSPPLGGGLHASGRRVVRGDADGAAVEEGKPKVKSAKRKAAVAASVLLAAVLGAAALKKAHHEPETAARGGPPSAEANAAPSAPGEGGAPLMTGGPAASASTPTLAVAPPADSAAGHIAPPAAVASADDGADPSRRAEHKKHARPAPFGNGPVHHGNILRLAMDGPVESIEGAAQPAGFTVKLPGRRSLEAAAPLAARDARIATIRVTNEPTGAELTVTFKDGVPNYQVFARGERLIIALSPTGPLETTVAKRDDKNDVSTKHPKRGREPQTAAARPSRAKDTSPER